MELELQGWTLRLALAVVALFVVAAPLGRAVYTNRDRAEDWHRRAIVAEESVGGLRTVIVERSRALNRRTVEANRLAGQLHSTRAALRRSKVNVGTLTRRQRELAYENARIEKNDASSKHDRRGWRRLLRSSARAQRASKWCKASVRARSPRPRHRAWRAADARAPASTRIWSSSVDRRSRLGVPGPPRGRPRCVLARPRLRPRRRGRGAERPGRSRRAATGGGGSGVEARAVRFATLSTGRARRHVRRGRATGPHPRVRGNPDRVGLRARLEDPGRATRRPSGRRRAPGSLRWNGRARPLDAAHVTASASSGSPGSKADSRERCPSGGASLSGRRSPWSAIRCQPSRGCFRVSSSTASRERRSAFTDA